MKLKKFFSSNIREISLIIVMIALSVFIEIRSGGNFFTLENISDMFTETAVLAITAVAPSGRTGRSGGSIPGNSPP